MTRGVGSSPLAWSRALLVAGLVVALDQATKQLATAAVERGGSAQIMFGIEIVNVRNRGIAFGLLSGGDAPILILTLGALALLWAYFLYNADKSGLWLAVGLLSGGAIGNLVDRLRIGSVIDFIDFPFWPAFNLADVTIVIGVAALALIAATPKPRHGERA